MEPTNRINQSTFNSKPFKVVYIILFTVILIVDMIITILLFTIWVNLEVTIFFRHIFFGFLFYYLIPFSPIIKIGFEIYEVLRFSQFLKSSNQDKESAINVVKGFKGTRIYRVYYLVLIACYTLWMLILEYTYMVTTTVDPDPTGFLRFSWWFSILLVIHILPLIMGPRIVKFSIDYMNKKDRNITIFDLILWTILLIVVFNIPFIMFFMLRIR